LFTGMGRSFWVGKAEHSKAGEGDEPHDRCARCSFFWKAATKLA